MEHAPEDDPHEPTNVPDDLEERAHRVYEYTMRRSGSGHTKYVKPQTEIGHTDYELMFDLMGLVPGTVFESGDTVYVVTNRLNGTVMWNGRREVERGVVVAHVLRTDGRAMSVGQEYRWTPGDSPRSALHLWESYIHGDVEVFGNALSLVE